MWCTTADHRRWPWCRCGPSDLVSGEGAAQRNGTWNGPTATTGADREEGTNRVMGCFAGMLIYT